MPNELSVINADVLTEDEKRDLDKSVEAIILAHKGNRQEINRLVFESVAAMTEADDAQTELSNKGLFGRLIGGVTGSNQKLQNKINENRAVAQYASQQTLQKLAEQNLMSFDLITAVNNKLNSSINVINEEFKEIYAGLNKFLRYNRNELARIETRLEKVERNVNLLTWQNSIEYQEYDGVEYRDMDVTQKIVCLVRDFYEITNGQWSTSDLLLLKTAMSTIDIQPNYKVNYYKVLCEIHANPKLKEKLLGNLSLQTIKDPSYIISLGVIEKLDSLNQNESYIVDTISDFVNMTGQNISRGAICDQIIHNYLWSCANVNVNTEVESYDLILDLLYNINQAIAENLLVTENDEPLELEKLDEVKHSDDQSEIKKMFLKCKIKEVLPLLKEYSIDGDVEARYILSLIYFYGLGVGKDKDYSDQMVRMNLDVGDPLSTVRGALSGIVGWERVNECIDEIKGLADNGDPFAQYELALYYLNLSSATNGEMSVDIEQTMKYLDMGAKQGFFQCYYSIGRRYYNGDLDSGVDYTNAMKNFLISAEMGDGMSMLMMGDMYYNGNGVDKNEKKAIMWYKKAYENCSSTDASINAIARYYSNEGNGDNSEALKWWEIGRELNYSCCTANLGWAYRWGMGTNVDYDKAYNYFTESIRMNPTNSPYARRNLAEMYLQGNIRSDLGYEVRKQHAINEYRGAANEGDATARQWLEDNGISLIVRIGGD